MRYCRKRYKRVSVRIHLLPINARLQHHTEKGTVYGGSWVCFLGFGRPNAGNKSTSTYIQMTEQLRGALDI